MKARRLELLPVWEQENHGRRRQYAWDGKRLHTVDVLDFAERKNKREGGGLQASAPLVWALGLWRRVERLVHSSLLPEDVADAYWPYMRWKFVQRLVSSMNQVNGTRSMLVAVGMGAKRSIGAAATLNWVLKDGLGRLGRLTYTASLGRTFDANLKRARFTTSVLFTLSLGLEMLTPLAPAYFLPMATLANVGKSIGFAGSLATNPSIHQSFSLGQNLADISAKGQGQAVIADNVGLALAVALGAALRSNVRARALMSLVAFPILGGIDLFSISQELRWVHLRTLNKERLEIIVDRWIRSGTVPSAREVSEAEGLLRPPRIGDGRLPLAIMPLWRTVSTPEELLRTLSTNRDVQYLLQLSPGTRPHSPLPRLLTNSMHCQQPQLVLSLRHDATTRDIITGVLQASHWRYMAASVRSLEGSDSNGRPEKAWGGADWVEYRASTSGGAGEKPAWRGQPPPFESGESPSPRQLTREERQLQLSLRRNAGSAVAYGEEGGTWPARDGWEREWREWAVSESHKLARKDVGPLVEAMKERGWETGGIMLTPLQRCTYDLSPK